MLLSVFHKRRIWRWLEVVFEADHWFRSVLGEFFDTFWLFDRCGHGDLGFQRRRFSVGVTLDRLSNGARVQLQMIDGILPT